MLLCGFWLPSCLKETAIPIASSFEVTIAEFYDLVVLEDVSVEQGSIIPWFNQPGQGIQIMFSEDIEELIKKGKIAIRNLKKIK